MESQLETTQWLAGPKPSSLDREALEEVLAAGGVSLLSPLTQPNCYAWYSIASKFKPEIRQSWPKAKAPAPAAAAAGNKNEAGQDKQGGKKGGRNNQQQPKKEESKKSKPAAADAEDDFDPFAEETPADIAAAQALKKKG